ncbi:response regulator transcription factor [Paenibacillus pini]|uniref:Phosphate regulon transcriptional regulatory protein PhoB n=1 Tax=Paenibacillus pini JCM 16418 TaxID=1236976 RepID=W7YWF2_9BACL|nr:response regulator transcription factor [Paenibacillus pini]GAF06654.1 phosphate regulon transcriptional regulatory protein PhoB [Paenibacillus pini JCM 16418]
MRNMLVVDDDKEIANLISIYLKNEGYEVLFAYNGEEALEQLSKHTFDLIILDVMMPKMDGLEVCRRVRADSSTVPILMLSAKTEDMDKIMGLMTGADDYMIKPFNPLELTVRVKTLLRRSFQYNQDSRTGDDSILRIHNIEINRNSHQVLAGANEVQLTGREFDILYLLGSHPSRVFSAEEIFQRVWKEKYYVSNNTVMVHISNLRDKLEKELGYKLIQTIWGVGYKIDA